MKKNMKRLIPTLLATVYTIPGLAGADEQLNNAKQSPQEISKTTIASEAVQQEVIQLLRQGETDQVTLNVAGQPGTHFRVFYSQTGKEDSYAPVPNGEGQVRDNGFGSVGFALKELGKEEVYLKVTTSDSADFAKTRVTPKPMILQVEPVEIQQRDAFDALRRKVQDTMGKPVRTPSAVAGVRG